MSHVCGIEHRGSVATAHRRAGVLFGVFACAVVLVLGVPVGALAGAGSPKPAPEPLWRSYPLDPAHSKHVPPHVTVARTPSGKPNPQRSDSSGPSPAVWIMIEIAALLAAVAAAYIVLRRTAPGVATKLRTAGARATSRGRRAGGAVRPWAARSATAVQGGIAGLLDHLRRIAANLVTDVRGGTAPTALVAAPEPPLTRLQPQPHSTTPRKEAVMKPEKATSRPKPIQTLKRKLSSSDEADQTDVLKQKLARPPRRRKPPPAPSPITVAPRFAAERECRIDWWRGYVRSEFYATEGTLDDDEAILMRSPSFRWAKPSPPPATLPHVAKAHAALVADLEAAGWIVNGRGSEWYALELKRRPARPSAARKGST